MEQRDSSVSNWNESGEHRYISQVEVIRYMRDIYKEGTEQTFDEAKIRLEQEGAEKKKEAEKAIVLMGHSRQTLQQLDEQRKFIGRNLKAQAEQSRALAEQIHQEVQRRTLDESAMRQLLNEIRHKNL